MTEVSHRRAVVWSIAGNDSGGGAGLSADLRAFDAFGVHGCPVVAVITAQDSLRVTTASPVGPELLDAQLAALAHDMPPRVIKTGALGSAVQIELVARWVDRLRQRGPVALVVDPVLKATTGLALSSEPLEDSYVRWLLPRATVITPNRGEAMAMARAFDSELEAHVSMPALAALLRLKGAECVCITGGDDEADGQVASDWIDCDTALGWLESPRIDTAHDHGTGCTFASSAAAALAQGHAPADALVLAKMSTAAALGAGYAAGSGAGPVAAVAGFAAQARGLPQLSMGPERQAMREPHALAGAIEGLYGIASDPAHLVDLVEAGVPVVQWRIKSPRGDLLGTARDLAAACAARGARLFINDHVQVALDLLERGIDVGLHLGQDDLLGLGAEGLAAIRSSGIALGVSSHAPWELCRARGLATAYIACGPVWPTTTKDMPWKPQGLHNLAWWRAMTWGPLAAIGGILDEDQVELAASSGADLVCVVRGLAVDRSRLADKVGSLEAARLRGRGRWLAAGGSALDAPASTSGLWAQSRLPVAPALPLPVL